MKIQYKNFIIEDDRNCFILKEFGIITKGKNQGEEGIIDQIYPSSLQRCFECILEKIKVKDNSFYELQEAIKEIKKINNDFLNDLKILLNNN